MGEVTPARISRGQIEDQALKLVCDGAQSYVEDALDEEGEFHPDDWAAIRKEAQWLIDGFRNREMR